MSPSGVLQFRIAKSTNDLQPSMYSSEILGFIIQLLSIALLCACKKELIKLHALYVGTLNVINLAEFRVCIEYEELIQIENQNRTSR